MKSITVTGTRETTRSSANLVALGELDGLRVDTLVEVLFAVSSAHLVRRQIGPEALRRRRV
jgi:hypothetical protein